MKKIFNIMMAAAISVCTFTACEDVPEPYNNPLNHFTPEENETIDPIGTGTADDPYNIAGVLDYVMTLGEATSPNDVYFKGIVTDVKEAFGTQYGNATFTLSDTEKASNKFLVYRGLYLGNVKYSDANAKNIDIGDEIIVCGKVLNYGGNTPETSSGNSYVYSINGEGGGGGKTTEKVVGSVDNPQTIEQAIAVINALANNATTEEFYYVKGKVSKINTTGENIAKYKNINYIISDGGKDLTVYQGRNLNNTDFTKDGEINVGDEVVVYGQLQKYEKDGSITPEMAKGNYIAKLGGGTTPIPSGKGSATDPYTVAEALAAINALADNGYSDAEVYTKGKVVKVTTNQTNFDKYGNLNYLISEDGSETNTITVYSGDALNGAKFTGIDALKAGDEVVVYGKLQKYVKNDAVTPEIAKGNYLYSLKQGGDTPTPSGKGTSVDNAYTVTEALAAINALADNGYSDAEVYTKGKVVKVTTNQTNFDKYGNLNYLISEDGSETNTITVYSGDALNGAKFTGIDALKAGDEVVVYGKLQKYVKNDAVTPEIAKGNYLAVLKSGGNVTPDPTPTEKGTATSPYTVAEALTAINALADNGYSDAEVYTKGKVVKVTTNQTNFDKYGNLNYLISEDGSETNTITVYSGDALNGAKFTGIDALKAGDEVVVYGKLQKYVKNNAVTPEIAKGNYLYSLKQNGSTTPDPTPTPGGNVVTYTMESLGLDNAAELNTQTLKDGPTVTFAAEENQNAPKYYTTGAAARVYAKNSITIKSNSKNITKVVLNCVASYIGNSQMFGEADGKKVTMAQDDPTVTFSGFNSKTLKIVNDYTEAKAGTQLRIVSIEITYAD